MRSLIKLKFLGGVAGSNLTGSCSLLTIERGKKTIRILIDAGLIQCGFNDSLSKNEELLKQIQPANIDFVILTHSHIDHIGRLPLLTKHGFKGRIICSTATKNLLGVMLEDSAKIQLLEAEYLHAKSAKQQNQKRRPYSRDQMALGKYDSRRGKKHKKTNSSTQHVLYTIQDVNHAISLVKNGGYDYHNWYNLCHLVEFKFYPSGHVMGGAIVVLKVKVNSHDAYFCFSGDLGRKDGIILPPPEVVKEPIDFMVVESTYGGKIHPTRDEEIQKILEIIRQATKNNQKVIIPSFALERSQEIIYLLSHFMEQGQIPHLPIYLDSPMASKITAVFAEGWDNGMFSDQAQMNFNPFDTKANPYFNVITEQKESNQLIKEQGSYIVIAGSGMCDAGRVRGHLRANLSNPNTVVCLVGYMAKNSLGQKLKNGALLVKMNNEEIKVNAKVASFDSFSAHADGQFLTEYTLQVINNNPSHDKQIFVVHGEGEGAQCLKVNLEENLPRNQKGKVKITIPKINQESILVI